MEGDIRVNDATIHYVCIEKPHLRNSYIRFVNDRLVVTSPSLTTARKMLQEHTGWIAKHYSQLKSELKLFGQNNLPFLGKHYFVAYREQRQSTVSLESSMIIVGAKDAEAANKSIRRWLKGESLKLALKLTREKLAMANEDASEICVRRGRKWGSCTADRRITYNYMLSMLRPELIDYVVSHEVAHLKEMNHSKDFWAVVETMCPNYRELRKELRSYDNREKAIVIF